MTPSLPPLPDRGDRDLTNGSDPYPGDHVHELPPGVALLGEAIDEVLGRLLARQEGGAS